MDKNLVNFAVIGTGMIFNTQRFIFKLNKRAKIIAVVDKNPQLAKKFGKKLKVPHFTDSKDLYNSDLMFDVVYIATPHFTHKDLVLEAIQDKKRKLAIFCDKPIAHTVKAGSEILKEVQEKNVKLGINYQYKYSNQAYSFVKMCQDKSLGKILYGKITVPWYRKQKYFEQGPWRKYWDKAGGGTLITHGSHAIDIMLWALGKPNSVIGKVYTRLHKDIGVETEDIAMGIIEFENGIPVQVLSSSCTKPGKMYVILEIFGEKGSIKLTCPWPFNSLHAKSIKKKKYKLDTKGIINNSKILNAFIDWVQFDKEFYSTGESSLQTLIVVEGLYNSSNEDKKIII